MKKQTYQVLDSFAVLRTNPDGTAIAEIRYYLSLKEKCFRWYISEYLDFENRYILTEDWWAVHSADPYPASNERAVIVYNCKGCAETLQVTAEYTAYFCRIVDRILGPIPPSADKVEPW